MPEGWKRGKREMIASAEYIMEQVNCPGHIAQYRCNRSPTYAHTENKDEQRIENEIDSR